jgi:hypothetical protein
MPWGFVGAILLIAAAERAIAPLELQISRTENVDLRMSRMAASGKKQAVPADVLCLGSSMIEEGILPRVIEERAGLKAYNLAHYGGNVPNSYYSLRRALASGARPSAVVLDLHPALITHGIGHDLQIWADSIDPRDHFDFAWTLGNSNLFAILTLADTLPSVRYRHQIGTWVRASLRNEGFSLWLENLAHIRNRNRNRGAFISGKNPNYHGEISQPYRSMLLTTKRPCDPLMRLYIHKLLNLAQEHGVRVYVVIPPLSPALQQERKANGFDDVYTRTLSSFMEHPNLVVLDARDSGFETTMFRDASHLDFEGANAFTTQVADFLSLPERVAAATGAPEARWVALPPYHATPIAVPVETLAETRQMLLSPETVRR